MSAASFSCARRTPADACRWFPGLACLASSHGFLRQEAQDPALQCIGTDSVAPN